MQLYGGGNAAAATVRSGSATGFAATKLFHAGAAGKRTVSNSLRDEAVKAFYAQKAEF